MFSALRSPNDPIRSLQRSIRITWLIGVVVISVCALWSWRPLNELDQGMVSINLREPPSTPSDSLQVPLDPSAFTAKLWNPPSPPPEVPEEVTVQRTVPRKPLHLQLIGIIDDGRQLRAALYDPEADRLLIVATGDHVKRHTITITADAVELADGRVTHRLTLRKDRS